MSDHPIQHREAIFRCDASPELGLGHLSRCSALAQELQNQGFKISFFLNKAGLELASTGNWPPSIRLAAETSLFEPSSHAPRFDLAIVDCYALDDAFEAKLNSVAREVIAIDDLGRKHAADVLIDTMPCPLPERYMTTSPDTLRLLGGSYALLRSEFDDPAKAWLESGDGSVLVSMGGTDSSNATGQILTLLEAIPDVREVTVVLGAAAPYLDEVMNWIALRGSRFSIAVQPKSMSDLYCRHTLAIGAPGMSALERACCGVPQILIETAQNQVEQSRALSLLGAALSLGQLSTLNGNALQRNVARLLADHDLRSEMSMAGRRTVDGLGSRRVAAILSADLRTNAGKRLGARPLQLSDRDIILTWQSHDSTRRYSRDPNPPSAEQHDKFIRSRAGKRNSIFEIITEAGEPRALVRAEERGGMYEISIVCSPDFRGQGMGSAAIRYVKALMHGKTLIAYVDPRNTSSISLFKRAGFEEGSASHRLSIALMN